MESFGDEVNGLEEGDYVIPTMLAECEACENCTSANTNLCLTYPLSRSGLMLDGTSRMSIKGQKLYHMFTCSTWSEYMVIDYNYVYKIDPTIPLPHASVLSCGFSTGFGAAWKEAQVKMGSTVAVLGLGAVGLGVCFAPFLSLRKKEEGVEYFADALLCLSKISVNAGHRRSSNARGS